MTQERRKVAVLGGSIAAMSGWVLLVGRDHPVAIAIWLGLLFVALVYVIAQLVKIKRSRKA